MRDSEGYIGLCHPLMMDRMWANRNEKEKSWEQLVAEANIAGISSKWEDGKLGGEMTTKS